MGKLSKDDWDTLDSLLGKHGFGGYYDLVECLKTVVSRIGKGRLKDDWNLQKVDLPTVVSLLMSLSAKESG